MNAAPKLRLFVPETDHGAVESHPSQWEPISHSTAPPNQLGRPDVGPLLSQPVKDSNAPTVSDVWKHNLKRKLQARSRKAATLSEYETAVSLWREFWSCYPWGDRLTGPKSTGIVRGIKLAQISTSAGVDSASESAPIRPGTAHGPAAADRGSVSMTEPHFYPSQHSEPPVDLISPAMLEAFQTWLESPSRGPGTVNKRIGDLQKIIRTAAKLGHCNGVPEIDRIPARKAGEKIKIPHAHIDAIYSACGVADWPTFARNRNGDRYQLPHEPAAYWRWLIVWLFNYGARLQDFVAYQSNKQPLTWSAIHAESESPRTFATNQAGWFYFVPSKTEWSKDLPLVLALNQATSEHLRAIRPGRKTGDDRIFPVMHDKRRFRSTWKAIVKAASVKPKPLQDPAGHGYQLKHFRDTCASYHDEQKAGTASIILGHTSPAEGKAITSAHYIDHEQRIADAMQQLPQPESFLAITDRRQGMLSFCDP